MITTSSFRPAWWLRGPHLQTLYPSLFRRRAHPVLQRERLELADGEIGTRIFVPLVNDGLAEVPESFFIELGRPDGGATIGPVVRAEVRIVDDDPPAGAR